MIHLVTAAKMEDSYNEQLQTENITNHYPLFARVQRQRPVGFSSGLRVVFANVPACLTAWTAASLSVPHEVFLPVTLPLS